MIVIFLLMFSFQLKEKLTLSFFDVFIWRVTLFVMIVSAIADVIAENPTALLDDLLSILVIIAVLIYFRRNFKRINHDHE